MFTLIDLLNDLRSVFGQRVPATVGFRNVPSCGCRPLRDSVQGSNVLGRLAYAFDRKSVRFELLAARMRRRWIFPSATRATVLSLEKALATNRRIGMAVAVVMAT